MTRVNLLILTLFLSGCAAIGIMEYDKLYGRADIENRLALPLATTKQAKHFHNNVQPIIENRCVVCHGCYDAPCQLKMENITGIERGANKQIVYNGERLLTANLPIGLTNLTQLNNENLQKVRQQGFFPVLNERQQSEKANTQASVFYQMLALKKQHPLPKDTLLNNSFDVSLNRAQQCPTIEEFEQYKQKYPLAGMPFGLPGLSDYEHNTLINWLADGAIMPKPALPTFAENDMISMWETLLNGSSNKEKLVARYLFEHLFLANLYFQDGSNSYFKLVRSTTPSGLPAQVIQSRRPFDKPTITQPFYYRLIKNNNTVLAKRHMPYPFGKEKMQRIHELFITPEYEVKALPSYDLVTSANPFATFADIPGKSRYLFLLDQAQFSIMNFIKGPVCRGQVALNVIDDHFWVVFVNPDNFDHYDSDNFISDNTDLLQLPASTSDKTMSLLYWRQYAKRQQSYVKNKINYVNSLDLASKALNLDLIWSGNGNPNATLTVFRHFDSASVLQGFVGENPKTAWLISYPILERIHYLLVAGFDVYGNVSHQLKTRLYMDFLRMEAESNFITFLPKKERRGIHEHWYRDTNKEVKDYIFSDEYDSLPETGIDYKTKKPKKELYQLLAKHTDNVTVNNYNLLVNNNMNNVDHKGSKNVETQLSKLKAMKGESINILPQVTYVLVTSTQGENFYSLINNSAHSNVAHLFSEEKRRIPAENTLSVLNGIVGTYPNAFFKVDETALAPFVDNLLHIKTSLDYQELKDNFAIRRTDSNFWSYADKLHTWYLKNQTDSVGLLDFNRLENR
jgi:hypothetical protein